MATTEERFRLFVAIDIPEELRRAVADTTRGLRAELASARWTPIENQHVTLKFLGSVDVARVEEMASACAAAAGSSDPLSLVVAGMGAFPSRKRARVLWAGIEDPGGSLGALAIELERRFEELGFPPEKRDFTAHLTLARFKTPQRLPELPDVDASAFDVTELTLYRSRLHPSGARYEPLARFELGGSGAS